MVLSREVSLVIISSASGAFSELYESSRKSVCSWLRLSLKILHDSYRDVRNSSLFLELRVAALSISVPIALSEGVEFMIGMEFIRCVS